MLAIVLTLASQLFSAAAGAQELTAVDNKSAKPRPAPRTADGHPDLSGYWKGTRDTVPGGNIAKDLPGLKLPLTPAGEAALQHNLTATIDPEALCIIGGIRGAAGIEKSRLPLFLQLLPAHPDRWPQTYRRSRPFLLR
jgi:hypothetical protein